MNLYIHITLQISHCLSFILFWVYVRWSLTSDKYPLFQEVSCSHRVRSGLCETSLLCSRHVRQNASPKERWPLTILLQVMSPSERTDWVFCPQPPPHPDPYRRTSERGILLCSYRPILKTYLNHQEEQGQYFSRTKPFFTVGLTFCLCLFFVLRGGYPQYCEIAEKPISVCPKI